MLSKYPISKLHTYTYYKCIAATNAYMVAKQSDHLEFFRDIFIYWLINSITQLRSTVISKLV